MVATCRIMSFGFDENMVGNFVRMFKIVILCGDICKIWSKIFMVCPSGCQVKSIISYTSDKFYKYNKYFAKDLFSATIMLLDSFLYYLIYDLNLFNYSTEHVFPATIFLHVLCGLSDEHFKGQ